MTSMPLDITVDVKSPTPPYEQIRSQIAAYIGAGLLGRRRPAAHDAGARRRPGGGHRDRGPRLLGARERRPDRESPAHRNRRRGGPAGPAAEEELRATASSLAVQARAAGLDGEAVLSIVRAALMRPRRAGSAGDVVELVGVRAGALAPVERGDRDHVRLVELEVEEREVLLDPAAVDRLREDDVAALDVPAEGDLRRTAAEPLGDPADDRVVGHLPAGDRRPGLGDDLVVGVERAELVLDEERADLDLVHRGSHLGGAEEVAQVVGLEVGDPDRLRPAGRVDLLHGLPARDVVGHRRQRPVDEEEVEVVEAQGRQAGVERPEDVVALEPVVVQLAGDEDLVARDPGLADGQADLALVAVHLRGVDVPVADLERRGRGLDGVLGLDLEDAEAQLGDLDAVVQGDRGRATGRLPSDRGGAAHPGAACRREPLPGRGALHARASALRYGDRDRTAQQRRPRQREERGQSGGQGRDGEGGLRSPGVHGHAGQRRAGGDAERQAGDRPRQRLGEHTGRDRDSTSEVPDTSTGAIVRPARKPQPISTGSEPTPHSSCPASPKATAVATNRAASVPGSRARPYASPATRLPTAKTASASPDTAGAPSASAKPTTTTSIAPNRVPTAR